MNIVDIVLLVLTALIIFVGFRKGFAASLVSMLSYVIGIPTSLLVSRTYSSVVYDEYVKQLLIDSFTKKLNEQGSVEEMTNNINNIFSSLPDFLTKDVDLSMLNSLSNDSVAAYFEEHVAGPIAHIVIEAVIFLVVFALIGVVCGIINAILKKLNKKKNIPFSRTNRFLGAVFGLIKAAVVVVVLSSIASLAVENTSKPNDFISALDSSVIIDFVNNNNPIL